MPRGENAISTCPIRTATSCRLPGRYEPDIWVLLANGRSSEDIANGIIDREKVQKRKKKASKRFRDDFGHTPVSVEERIPWKCRSLITNEILFIPAGIEVETIDRDDGSSAIASPLPFKHKVRFDPNLSMELKFGSNDVRSSPYCICLRMGIQLQVVLLVIWRQFEPDRATHRLPSTELERAR